MKKIYRIISVKYRNLKNLKYHTLRKNISSFCYCSKCKNEDEKLFKEK